MNGSRQLGKKKRRRPKWEPGVTGLLTSQGQVKEKNRVVRGGAGRAGNNFTGLKDGGSPTGQNFKADREGRVDVVREGEKKRGRTGRGFGRQRRRTRNFWGTKAIRLQGHGQGGEGRAKRKGGGAVTPMKGVFSSKGGRGKSSWKLMMGGKQKGLATKWKQNRGKLKEKILPLAEGPVKGGRSRDNSTGEERTRETIKEEEK